MLAGLFKQPRCPIGIDVGTRSVKMMQVDRQADRLVVLAAGSCHLQIESSGYGDAFHQAVADAVRHLLDAHHFVGRNVVSCLPASAVHYKNLRLPKMPPDELPAAVQWEANDRLHLGEPAVTQFIDAGVVHQGEEQRQEVILLAATRSLIECHARALTSMGLQLAAIDAIPSALARCLGRSDSERVQVVIDIGYAQSKVLICRGQHVLFYKQIDLGGESFDQAVADRLELTSREASDLRRSASQRNDQARRAVEEAVRPRLADLAREIGLCLRYYSVTFRGQRPDRAILIGGEAAQPGLSAAVSEGAGIEVLSDDPLAGFDLTRIDKLDNPSDWVTAAGLALRSLDSESGKRGAA